MKRNEIKTKEKNLTINETAKSYLVRIYEDLYDIRKSFIRLGFHLAEIEKCGYYKDAGYDDFYDFCEDNYALSRSSVQRYILVWYKFADYDSTSNSRKMWISEKFDAFNFSQLVEMASMKHPEKIKPEMTVKEIREYKKNLSRPALDYRICDYSGNYVCQISEVIKKHFMQHGSIVGCVGCCMMCTRVNSCQYRCQYAEVHKNLPDVAQKEDYGESEIDMQRDNLLDQLNKFYNSITGCWERLTLSEREYIDQQYEMLKTMMQLLH